MALYTIVIVVHVLKERAVIKVQSGLRGTNRFKLSYLVVCGAAVLVLEGSGRLADKPVGSDVVGDACETWVVSDDGRTDALGPVEVGSRKDGVGACRTSSGIKSAVGTGASAMGYATKVGTGALMGSPGASVNCRGRTSTVGTGASLMGSATKVGTGALMGSPGASVHCRGRTPPVGIGSSPMGYATKVPTIFGAPVLMGSPTGASVTCRGERRSATTSLKTKVGTGALMGCKVGSPTGASVTCRGERKSSEPLRTGVARPRAERRPNAGRRLRLCMTVLCDTGDVRCFTLDPGRAQDARVCL